MARPVEVSRTDFSITASTTVTTPSITGLQAGDLLTVFPFMRSASTITISSVTDTIDSTTDLDWGHANDDDSGVSNHFRDAQNIQNAAIWRAYIEPGDNSSGTITLTASATVATFYGCVIVSRASAGGTLGIDRIVQGDQGATDTDPGTVTITPSVDSRVIAAAGNRQDTFVDFDGTLTALGASQVAGAGGDQMRWHVGVADGVAGVPKVCTFDYSAVGEWIVQAVSIEETAAGGGAVTVPHPVVISQAVQRASTW